MDRTVSGVIYIRHADDGMDVRPLYKLPIKRKRKKETGLVQLRKELQLEHPFGVFFRNFSAELCCPVLEEYYSGPKWFVLRKPIHLVFFQHAGRPLWRMTSTKYLLPIRYCMLPNLFYNLRTYENRLNTFRQALRQFTAFFP